MDEISRSYKNPDERAYGSTASVENITSRFEKVEFISYTHMFSRIIFFAQQSD